MPYDENDPWSLEGEGGGLKDDFDGKIVDASFGRTQYNEGKTTVLTLTVLPTEPGASALSLFYPLGPGWETYDGGKTVVHPDRKVAFNANTGIGELLRRVLRGTENRMPQAKMIIQTRGKDVGPRAANIWEGLIFHWNVDRQEKTFKDNGSGEMVTRTVTRTYPSAFVGVADAEEPQDSSETIVSAGHTVVLASSIAGQVRKLALTKPDHKSFVDAVIAVPGALGNDELVAVLPDESFYAGLRP